MVIDYIFPLFTENQRNELGHLYYTCLKRVRFCLGWSDEFFAYVFDEISLTDRCAKYWNKYLVALADSVDGELLFERASLNVLRQSWVQKEYAIRGLRVSKRFVENVSVLEKCVRWIVANSSRASIPQYAMEEIVLLQHFPESFLFL